MNFLALILSGLKTPAEALVTQLKDNEAANVATIESLAGGAEAEAVPAVEKFVSGIAAKNAELSVVYNAFVAGPLTAELNTLQAQGNATIIPSLYAAGVAFLAKEAALL